LHQPCNVEYLHASAGNVCKSKVHRCFSHTAGCQGWEHCGSCQWPCCAAVRPAPNEHSDPTTAAAVAAPGDWISAAQMRSGALMACCAALVCRRVQQVPGTVQLADAHTHARARARTRNATRKTLNARSVRCTCAQTCTHSAHNPLVCEPFRPL
jgi:hypothetical protein